MQRIFLTGLIGFTWICGLYCQVKGKVMDVAGEPLPHVSVYFKHSSVGTSTNSDGLFFLHPSAGSDTIVFQHLGYVTVERSVAMLDSVNYLEVILSADTYLLNEVIVTADAEDPAYRVVREAIRKREFFRTHIDRYSCDVYVKGHQRIRNAPEKIFGFEIGDLDGALDSNRQGIVYLSESISRLYYRAPDDFKEVVFSSLISGDDQGYSFNSAREMEINFYDNTIWLNRNLISPIATNALAYYRYRLLGTFYDNDNRLVNKIEVIPKRSSDPVFRGIVYIVEDLWNLFGVDLNATGQAMQLYFVDSLNINQVNVPVRGPDEWRTFTNTISFEISALGFQFDGLFTAVYSNYDLELAIEAEEVFNRDVYVVEESSNQRDSAYWSGNRPIPLTAEEVRDYQRKDSIFQVRNHPDYLDSIDQVNNRLKVSDLIAGYDFQQTRRHIYGGISTPLLRTGYNTVQGLYSIIEADFRKYFDEKETRRILFNVRLNYGFAEKKERIAGRVTYRPSRLNRHQYWLAGGSNILQFNTDYPMLPFQNLLYTLFARKNYAKYYARRNISAGLRRELANGITLSTVLSWEERYPLQNRANYSFYQKGDRVFTPNDPTDSMNNSDAFPKHQAFILRADLDVRFHQKYVVYPDRRFDAGSRGPEVRLSYRGALPIGQTDLNFHELSVSLSDQLETGVAGELRYFIRAGSFVRSKHIEFMDYQHFYGMQTAFTLSADDTNQFLNLPFYDFSSMDKFAEFHIMQAFDGFILDKIPLVNRLGFGLVSGIKLLVSRPHPTYGEWHIGVDKIGFKMMRILRFDVFASRVSGITDVGWRIGIKLDPRDLN